MEATCRGQQASLPGPQWWRAGPTRVVRHLVVDDLKVAAASTGLSLRIMRLIPTTTLPADFHTYGFWWNSTHMYSYIDNDTVAGTSLLAPATSGNAIVVLRGVRGAGNRSPYRSPVLICRIVVHPRPHPCCCCCRPRARHAHHAALLVHGRLGQQHVHRQPVGGPGRQRALRPEVLPHHQP